jgi:hypothetical protein
MTISVTSFSNQALPDNRFLQCINVNMLILILYSLQLYRCGGGGWGGGGGVVRLGVLICLHISHLARLPSLGCG